MPDKRDLQLDRYGISKHRYKELANFCLQYEEFKQEKESCYSLDGCSMDGMPRGSATSDSTANKAGRAYKLSKNIELIESTAVEAAGRYYRYLLIAVTEGRSWDSFENPYKRAEFNLDRRKFFYILNLKKS